MTNNTYGSFRFSTLYQLLFGKIQLELPHLYSLSILLSF